MDRLLQSFRDYPAVVGIGFFVFISVFLAVLLGSLMHRAGLSLKPLVFFFGFLAIVGVPQASVHLLDALAHRRAMSAAGNPIPRTDGPKNATPPVGALQPVPWETVFGPSADPSLMTDAKRGLDAILGEAVEAKLSFSAAGESAPGRTLSDCGSGRGGSESLRYVFPICPGHRK